MEFMIQIFDLFRILYVWDDVYNSTYRKEEDKLALESYIRATLQMPVNDFTNDGSVFISEQAEDLVEATLQHPVENESLVMKFFNSVATRQWEYGEGSSEFYYENCGTLLYNINDSGDVDKIKELLKDYSAFGFTDINNVEFDDSDNVAEYYLLQQHCYNLEHGIYREGTFFDWCC